MPFCSLNYLDHVITKRKMYGIILILSVYYLNGVGPITNYECSGHSNVTQILYDYRFMLNSLIIKFYLDYLGVTKALSFYFWSKLFH